MATNGFGILAGGFSIFFFLLWLAGIVFAIYMLVLTVKLARRGIIALDLYIHSKNVEIRSQHESFHKGNEL